MTTLGKVALCLATLLVSAGSASANVQAEVEEVRLDAVFEDGRRGPLAGGVLSLRIANRTDEDISMQTSPVQVRHGRRLVTSCTIGIVSLGEVGMPLQVTRGAYVIPAGETRRLRMIFHCRMRGRRAVARNRPYRVVETLSWHGGQTQITGRARLTGRARPTPSIVCDSI